MAEPSLLAVVSFIGNIVLALIAWLLKRQVIQQDDRMENVEELLSEYKHRVQKLEVGIASEYVTKQEHHALRLEINENFREVQRDLKTIIRNVAAGKDKSN